MSDGTDRGAVRAALLALLDNLTEPALVQVVRPNGRMLGAFDWGAPADPAAPPEADIASDVIRFFEDRGQPMTLPQIMDDFRAEGNEVEERTVRRHLRQLAAQGRISRPGHGAHDGYRLLK